MTTFVIWYKHKNKERYRRSFTTTDPKRAELVAVNECKLLGVEHVKVIATDDNGVTNEIIYK